MESTCYNHGVNLIRIQSRLSGSEQLRHPSDQLLMVAKQRISCSHIRIGVFTGLGIRMLVSNGMEHQDAVCLFQQLLCQGSIRLGKEIFVSIEMVEHFEGLKERFSLWNHTQPLLFQLPCVIDREGVSLNGTTMR